MSRRSLDLGCGNRISNPYNADDLYGVDIMDLGIPNIKQADLAIEPIPFEDNYFNYVTAYDFIEHIPRILYYRDQRINPFINLMNEIYRVLVPGGIFRAHTPAIPHAEAFQDPTHVNFITTETVQYFAGYHKHHGEDYGFNGNFMLLKQYWSPEYNFHLVWELIADKRQA